MIEIAAGHFVEIVLSDSECWQIRMRDSREAREREFATERAFLAAKNLFMHNCGETETQLANIDRILRFELGML